MNNLVPSEDQSLQASLGKPEQNPDMEVSLLQVLQALVRSGGKVQAEVLKVHQADIAEFFDNMKEPWFSPRYQITDMVELVLSEDQKELLIRRYLGKVPAEFWQLGNNPLICFYYKIEDLKARTLVPDRFEVGIQDHMSGPEFLTNPGKKKFPLLDRSVRLDDLLRQLQPYFPQSTLSAPQSTSMN